MLRSIAFMPRRADTARADFRTYYETRHTPLALSYFRFSKYVRNHIIGGDDIGYDCLSEFEHDENARSGDLMKTEIGDIMRADERRFTDQPRIRPAAAELHQLAGPPRGFEPGPVRKIMRLLRAGVGTDRGALIDAAGRLAPGHGRRVTLDLLSPFDDRDLPCDAFLTVWGEDDGTAGALILPDGWRDAGTVEVEAVETAPDVLAAQPAV